MSDTHIPFADLLALAANELAPQQAAQLTQQLAADRDSATLLERIRSTLRTMCTDDSTAPPAQLVARVKALFARQRSQRPSWLDGLQQWVAELLYDSRVTPALVGFRAAQEAVQLSFGVAEIEIDVQLDPPELGAGCWAIHTQVPKTIPAPVEACLLEQADGAVVATVQSDEHGLLRMDAPPGSYELALRWGSDRVVRLGKLECR